MKRKIISGLIVIFVIFGMMFWSNFKTKSVRQLQGPIEGTDYILTVNNKLSVISKNNQLFTWQWNNLSVWPIVAKPQAAAIIPIAEDKILYNSSVNPEKLILTDLKADKDLTSLSLPYGAECKKIKISSNMDLAIRMIWLRRRSSQILKGSILSLTIKWPSSLIFWGSTTSITR